MTDYTELKRLAEAAIVALDKYNADECNYELAEAFGAADDAFHDAAGPATVLALIAENERLDAINNQMILLECNGGTAQAAINLLEERDKLRAEVAGLRTGYEAYEQVNAELKAENERLRAGLKGDYDLDAWLDWTQEAEELRKEADKWKSVQRAGDQLLADEGRAAIWSACSRILISVANELNSGRSVVTEEGVTKGGVEIGDWRVTVERIDAALGQGERS
ncbi:hypothetical protein JJD66_27445 [Pseudomonas sp. MF6751]|uniref:hypothetical protein n=1 Tax=Pseudomonas sp. MF6751 TaxID=2797528 RepID=UPI00190BD46C|nr:hypothetical protein [Pseudomonas sp. MF6751]MBK3479821.1 hypothetical protein [Pseudomonas sp. MF6751]